MRHINEIAKEISVDWHNVNYAAKPYLNAMFSLTDINSKCGVDSAPTIIMYFLSNASSWRGEVARRVKKELNQMLK